MPVLSKEGLHTTENAASVGTYLAPTTQSRTESDKKMQMMIQFDWLGHIVEALVMAGIVGVAAMALYERRVAVLIGLAFAGGHFHGREKRDYEISVHMPPPHLDAYLMWRWSWDQMTDFWPAALVVLTISVWLYRRWFPKHET